MRLPIYYKSEKREPINPQQQNPTSCCGDLTRNAAKADPTGPPKATRDCETKDVTIARASAEDLQEVLCLLESLHLPTSGVADHFGNFFVAKEKDGRLVGVIGLECYGNLGLLRSAAVAPGRQKSGVGSRLTRFLIEYVKAQGLTELVLFTPTALGFFARLGFVPANRENYHALLKASAQWGDCSCRCSAEFMRLELRLEESCGCKGHSVKASNSNDLLKNATPLFW
jgi:amino-acid N-acetyltransferase